MDKVLTFKDDSFRLYFPYDPKIVAAVRELPVRSFRKEGQDAFWIVPYVPENAKPLASLVSTLSFSVDELAASKISDLNVLSEAEQISKHSHNQQEQRIPQILGIRDEHGTLSHLHIKTTRYDPNQNSVIKSAPNAKWDANSKLWVVPFTQPTAHTINELVSQFGYALEDGLAEILNAQLKQYKNSIDQSARHDANIELPSPPGLNYLGYQRAGIAYALEKRDVLIADEPGLGKTIQAIGIANSASSTRSILVICPASLKLNWRKEWTKWDVKALSVGIVNGGKESDWPIDSDVVVINFDLVGKHIERIRDRQWNLMVVDEAHNLRNPKAKRTQNVFGRDAHAGAEALPPIVAQQRILLTGTPIVNRPIELWTLVHALAPGTFANFFSYAKRYCGATHNGYGWDFSGATNLEELQDLLRATCMVRRTKKEVLTDLPPKTRQIIEIEDSKIVEAEQRGVEAIKQRIEALEAEKILAYLSDDSDAYRSAVEKLRDTQSATFEEISRLRHETSLAKVPKVVELVTDALEQGKVILFAHHKDVIASYRQAFGDLAVCVDGGTPNTQRQENADRFQTDPTCRLFIGSIGAAGVGFTLTASSHVIFGELDWVPGNVSQAEDRAHRIGQKDNVLVWHTVVNGTIDAKMARVLIDKQRIIDAALDDATNNAEVSVANNPAAAIPEAAASIEATDFVLPDFQIIPHSDVEAWLANSNRFTAMRDTSRMERVAQKVTSRAVSKGLAGEAAALSSEQVETIRHNLQTLAAVCDGASTDDGVGFNGVDAKVGAALAGLPRLDQLQAAYARMMLSKYRRQLGSEAIDAMYRGAPDILQPVDDSESVTVTRDIEVGGPS